MTGRVSIFRVARTGHPFFFLKVVLATVLALALQPFAGVHAAATNGYRLAGIVAVGSDYLGFLELPGGGQVLVRRGSTINGGGRIVALDSEQVTIVFPDRTIELDLAGSDGRGAAPATRGMPIDVSDEAPLVMREVDSATVARALKASGGTGNRADAATDVARRFTSVVALPHQARVISVNEVPVTSADTAIGLAEKSLARGGAVSLKIAATGNQPETRVYLLPARD